MSKEFSRKTFVKGGGALIVGFSALGAATAARRRTATDAVQPARRRQDFLPDLTQVDSWITLNADNTVIVTHGETELGSRHPDRHPDARRRRDGHEHEPDERTRTRRRG